MFGPMSQLAAGTDSRHAIHDRAAAPRAHVLGWGTALPRFRYAQREIAEWIAAGRSERDGRRIRAAFERSGVATRSSCLPDFGSGENPRLYETGRSPTTADRMRAFEREAPPLAREAALRAISGARIPAHTITHVFAVTCTGFSAPGFDCELIESLGLSPAVRRVLFGFQGCSAGLAALRTAAEVVRGDPDALVLVVAVELSSLHFQPELAEEDVRGHALFADGAGAAVVGSRARLDPKLDPKLGASGAAVEVFEGRSLLVSDARDAMSWRVTDAGFLMRLSPEVPARLAEVLPDWIGASGAPEERPDVFAIHPGGPAILSRVESALGLAPDACCASRAVLREHGNMSSATIFFVFEEIARTSARGSGLALAFGPGLTIDSLAFRLSNGSGFA